MPLCVDVLCKVLNSKFTHRLCMNDRVLASRVSVKLTKASLCTGVMPECKGVLLCMDI